MNSSFCEVDIRKGKSDATREIHFCSLKRAAMRLTRHWIRNPSGYKMNRHIRCLYNSSLPPPVKREIFVLWSCYSSKNICLKAKTLFYVSYFLDFHLDFFHHPNALRYRYNKSYITHNIIIKIV